MEASSYRRDQLSLHLYPLPFPEGVEGEFENPKLPIMAQASWHPAAIQEPTQICLLRTKDAPSALIPGGKRRLLGALCQKWGQRTASVFSIAQQQ